MFAQGMSKAVRVGSYAGRCAGQDVREARRTIEHWNLIEMLSSQGCCGCCLCCLDRTRTGSNDDFRLRLHWAEANFYWGKISSNLQGLAVRFKLVGPCHHGAAKTCRHGKTN